MTNSTYPTVRLRPNIPAQKFRFGVPWCYANELVLDRRTKKTPSGSFVNLVDNGGQFLGVCAFNADSKITARIMDRSEGTVIDRAWITHKLKFALEMRDTLFEQPFYRWVHAEADGLPGVIIDRFGETVVIQPNSSWAEQMIEAFADIFVEEFAIKTVVKNSSGRARKLEGLDNENSILTGQVGGPIPVSMNGAIFMADVDGGQKTGLFFDQRDNHAFAAKLSNNANVLDVFSHVGGFSLTALAHGAAQATAIDGSASALELANQGAKAMGVEDKFTILHGDAFDRMDELRKNGQTFDVVVCDPPAFAPNKPALAAGLRAYERAARMAAHLVTPGGYLVLCSCSHAADIQKFRQTSLAGIGKAGRSAQILRTGYAGADHPTHAHLNESAYLKAIFCRLD